MESGWKTWMCVHGVASFVMGQVTLLHCKLVRVDIRLICCKGHVALGPYPDILISQLGSLLPLRD